MMNRAWEPSRTAYPLWDGYTLERASPAQLSVYFAVYRIYDDNAWFRQNWQQCVSATGDSENWYWILLNGTRIGAVQAEPNYMFAPVFEPPFSDVYPVVKLLKRLLLEWSDPAKGIEVHGVRKRDESIYARLGFRHTGSRRCMIRPTEILPVDWVDGFVAGPLLQEDAIEIGHLLNDAFQNTMDGERLTMDDHLASVRYYFEHNDEQIRRASVLVRERHSRQAAAVCMVSMWEGLPLFYEIAVLPKYRGRNIASCMMRQALSALFGQFPVVRLFVTVGNHAEQIYHDLGFLSGSENMSFRLLVQSTNFTT